VFSKRAAHVIHASLNLLLQLICFLWWFFYNLVKFWITFKVELINCVKKLLLLDTSFFEEFILGAVLFNKGFQHHFHLTFIGHLIHILHARVIHHFFHLYQLEALLFFKCFECLLLREKSTICGFLPIFLNLKQTFLIGWVLGVVYRVLLEFLLVNLQLLHYLFQFIIDDLLFHFCHLDTNFLVSIFIIKGSASFLDKLLLLVSKLNLCISGAYFKNFKELFEVDMSACIPL